MRSKCTNPTNKSLYHDPLCIVVLGGRSALHMTLFISVSEVVYLFTTAVPIERPVMPIRAV